MSDAQRAARPGRTVPGLDAQRRSDALKERVYVTFTALVVTIAIERDAELGTVGAAAPTLSLTVVGTVLAVFVADVLAHMVRESSLPPRAELAHLMFVSFGSLGMLPVPIAILGLSELAVIELALAAALRVIAVTLIVTLVVVTLLAVARLRVRPALKVFDLSIVVALGLAAFAVELAAH